ncbi:MAG: exodeoxyribonuclease VII small subunit [Saezia sp.]
MGELKSKTSQQQVADAMSTSRNTIKSTAPQNFEKALKELEELVGRMESGALPLDDLLTNYQRGAQLIAYCKDRLKTVEDQVQLFEGAELKFFSVDAKNGAK